MNIRLQEIIEVQGGLAEELVGALCLQFKQRALDRANAGTGDVAIASGEGGRVFRNVLAHRSQILHVEQEQPVFVRNPKNDVEDAALNVVELQEASEHERTHL